MSVFRHKGPIYTLRPHLSVTPLAVTSQSKWAPTVELHGVFIFKSVLVRLKRLESSSDKTNFARVGEDFPVEKRPSTQVHTEAAVRGTETRAERE